MLPAWSTADWNLSQASLNDADMSLDASRFLAQSQSRISFRQPDDLPTRNPLERPRRHEQHPSSSGRPSSRYPHTSAGGVRSQLTQHFPTFGGSRTNAAPAPLFYSAADDFREEDDEQEHEREVADFYALQRSRRQFVQHRPLDESSEADDDGNSRASGTQGSDEGVEAVTVPAGGIRSSWNGDKRSAVGRRPVPAIDEVMERDGLERQLSDSSSNHMYDVGLQSTVKNRDEYHDDEPPNDLTVEMDDEPPSVQHFRKIRDPRSFIPRETDADLQLAQPSIPDSDTSSVPPSVGPAVTEAPRHDAFWGNLYVIAMVAIFASFVLVWLHTAPPTAGKPLKDTIYAALHASYYLLAVDTVVAVIVALLWLALLRSYVRPLIYTILVAVPVILFSFSLYTFVSSFQHTQESRGYVQDAVMRWFSSLPGILGIIWLYGVYKTRQSFGKAIGILEFACKILAANPALLLLGFGTLGGVVLWTWLWMGMFTRIFLNGHTSTGALYFVVDVGAWWLSVFFVLMYLWTLGVGAGVQRATTAATVSQWYFHRMATPAPSSGQVVAAALSHAGTTLFGTICLSTLLTLLVRLPVLVLPRRFMAIVGFFSYTLIPSSILTLTHPTTLTYAAIHSQALEASAHAVSQLPFMHYPRGRFGNHNRAPPRTSSIRPYNLALLLLHATRLIAAMAFGFGAWVDVARRTELAGARFSGSIYAWVVGAIAAAIGWAILGAMESVLAGIVDAVVICWASEVRNGGVKYCREAGYLFGGEDETPIGDEEARGGEGEGLMGRPYLS